MSYIDLVVFFFEVFGELKVGGGGGVFVQVYIGKGVSMVVGGIFERLVLIFYRDNKDLFLQGVGGRGRKIGEIFGKFYGKIS